MRRLRFIFLALACATSLVSSDRHAAGAHLDSLMVGANVYRNVHIRSINARTVIFTHAGGMASLKLADLPADLQARFGYDPSQSEAPPASKLSPPPSRSSAAPRPVHATSPFDQLPQRFGQPAPLSPELDLRPKYFELELHVKNQGRRPSCAVFAIVSALEFQHAQLTGTPQKFSEEYLIWATRQTTARVAIPRADELPEPAAEDADEGFALEEVVAALRAFGIPLQSAMPNTVARGIDAIPAPPANVVEAAKNQRRVFIHSIPGRDNLTRINNLVHALNAGLPVPVGLAWPNFRSLRTGYLGAQTPLPGVGHAVTLVGYKSPSGKIEDAIFVFKNSWGVAWGQGGYGWVTFDYLNRHLHSAALLEVQLQ